MARVNPASSHTGPNAQRHYYGKTRQPGPPLPAPDGRITYPTGMFVGLARRPRSIGTKVGYRLSPPATLDQAAQTPLVTGPLGALAVPPQRRSVHYKLSLPVVAPPTVTTILKTLAATQPRKVTHYRLSPPQVVAPIVPALLKSLADQPPRRLSHYKLSAPATLVQPGQPPVVASLLKFFAEPKPRRKTISVLGGPVVVSPVVQIPVTKLRVTLVQPPRQVRQPGYGLAAPTIVDLPSAAPVRVTLAQFKLRRTKFYSRLQAPTILGVVVPPEAPAAQSTYNYGQFLDRGGQYERDHGKRLFSERYKRRG